jgi:predicted secreted protein
MGRHSSLGFVAAALTFGCLVLQAAHAAADEPVTATEKSNKGTITLIKGQELRVSLEGRAGTGYIWQVKEKPAKLLAQIGEAKVEQSDDRGRVGGPVRYVFRFKALAAGDGTLALEYLRPFEKQAKPAKTFQVKVTVKGRSDPRVCLPSPLPLSPGGEGNDQPVGCSIHSR